MSGLGFESLFEEQPEAFVRRLLKLHGLPAESLWAAESWSNDVWIAPDHVVRLSSGRFRDAFAHEVAVIQLLPLTLPHAAVRAYGRVGRREWMVLDRIAGRPLVDVWPHLSASEQRAAVTQLAAALSTLHVTKLPVGFDNPWLSDALGPAGHPENAYHAPPDHYGHLLDAVLAVPGVDRGLLSEMEAFITTWLGAFAEDSMALVHTDIHFANLLWDNGRLTAILDFEGARPAAPDLELDTILRFAREPWLYRGRGDRQALTHQDVSSLPGWLEIAYPELFSHPQLIERLAVYEALWQLVQLLHFPPGNGSRNPYGHLVALLEAGDRWAAF